MTRRLVAPALLALLTLAGCSSGSSRGPSPPREAAAPPAPRAAVEAPPKTPAPEASQPPAPAPAPAPAQQSQPPSPTAPPVVQAPRSAPRAPVTAAPAPAPQTPKRFVVFNFDSADVEVVLQAASEIVGFNYVIAPSARGRKVTIQTPARIATDEVFNVLLTVLDVNGLAAVRSGNLYRIIPREGAPQTSVRTSVGSEVDPLVPGDEILTQIVPLRYISGTAAVNLLRPFVAQAAALAAHRETNMLIITDTAANIRRLLDLLRLADVQVALEELKIIPLKYADAQEMAQLLTQIFAGPRFRPGTAVAGPAPAVAPQPAGAPAVPAASRAPGVEAAVSERPPLIVPERRSNSLIVNAAKQEMEAIRRLVEQLDVDIYGGQRVFIYFAENVKAADLASTLDAIFGRGAGAAVTGSQGTAGTSAPGGMRPGAPPYTPPAPAPAPAPGRTSQAGAARPPGAGLSVGEEGGTVTGEVRFIADQVTNSIIVTTYPRNWKDILDTIKKLDKMPRQVLIEVLAAEVTLTDDTALGIEWAIRSGRFDVSNAPSGVLAGRPPQSLIPFGGATAAAGLNFFTFGAHEFLTALNALASLNKVNVLSSPSIMTAENKKAVINVSRSVPILTSQQIPIGGTTVTTGTTAIVGTQSVEYRDAGIILTVTPRIGEGGTVALEVRQEVSDVGAPQPQVGGSPEFLKREAETSVVLLNNQTLVLGGLIQNRKTYVRSGIPFLNQIPVLRYLFGTTEEKIEKTELLLLITPRVVGTALDAARLTEQMRRITPGIQESVERAPRPPSGAR